MVWTLRHYQYFSMQWTDIHMVWVSRKLDWLHIIKRYMSFLRYIVFWHITANQYNIKRQSNHYDIFASNVWDPFIFVIIIYLAIKLLLFFPLLSRSMMTARPLWLPNGQYKNSMIWMMSIEVYRASSSSLAAPPSRPRPLVSKTIYPAICLRGARNKSRLFYLERLHDFSPARLNL